jgi:carboxyl-terminal processing protease
VKANCIIPLTRSGVSQTSVTLNEAKLKAERDLLEIKGSTSLNQLRATRGLPSVKKGDKTTKADQFDLLEDERLRIIIDMMKLTEANRLTKNKMKVN